MAFSEKLLQAKFTLLPNQQGVPQVFQSTGTAQLTLERLRMTCMVSKAGGAGMNTLQLAIFGMHLNNMNDLSTLGLRVQYLPKALVTVTASEVPSPSTPAVVTAPSVVISNAGVQAAYADIQGSAFVSFRVLAHAGIQEAVKNATETRFPGTVPVATIMEAIARKAEPPLIFENNGVTETVTDRTYVGTVRQQAATLAREAGKTGIGWTIDDNILAIWPKNGSRIKPVVPVSKQDFMVGYPSYTAAGLQVKTEYNPRFIFGGQIQVNSLTLPAANKLWTISSMTHELSTIEPAGPWETSLNCFDGALSPPPTTGGR